MFKGQLPYFGYNLSKLGYKLAGHTVHLPPKKTTIVRGFIFLH